VDYKLIDMKVFGDERGRLISFEKGNNCPFEVKRSFYIFDTIPGVVRGSHANRNSEFMLIAISGSCKIKVDDGKKQEIVELNTPHQGLYLGKMMWKDMYDFSYNAILLVLTNTMYDEKEYIRDYDEFLKEVNR
jgi:dTDP-4-dehydrorhamnose 3,5-epimerase and related enzymes